MDKQKPSRYRSVLFLGAPGTGKGTQSKAIGCLPGYFIFSAGAVLRSLEPDSQLGRKVGEYLSRGDLVPNDVVLQVWQSHMQSAVRDGAFTPHTDTLLLDGYPRDVEQAELLEEHIELQVVIHLKVDDDRVLKKRIRKRDARPDDRDEEVIRHRFEVYRQQTRPLLSHFDQSRIATVDAACPPLKVLYNVAEALFRFSD